MTREEAIKELTEWCEQMKSHGVPEYGMKYMALGMAIEALQEQKQGEWIEDGYCDRHCVCSHCGGSSGTQFDGVQPMPLKTKLCPNCGARMLNINSKRITEIGE